MDLFLIFWALTFLLAIPRIKWHRRPDPLFEYYNTGDDLYVAIYGAKWSAQTFTVGAIGHTVTSVKIKAKRYAGSPGTVTLGIRATDGSGHPTGSDLTSGSQDGNSWSTTMEWHEFALTEQALSPSTKYAVVVRAPSGNTSNYIQWADDQSSPSYTGGNEEDSVDSGSSWTTFANRDFMFEVWGGYLPPSAPTNCSVSILTETSLRVSWTDASTTEDDFHVERKTGAGGTYAEVQIVVSTTKASTGTVYRLRGSLESSLTLSFLSKTCSPK